MQARKLEIQIFFPPQNCDFAGLMMGPKKFAFWPFQPELEAGKVASKSATPRRFFVKCASSGDFFDILVCQGNNEYKLNNFNLTEEMEMDDLTPDADPDQAEDELN